MTQRAIDGPYVYHVTTNVSFGERYFDSPEKAKQLGRFIRNVSRECDFTLFGYGILLNHVHVLIKKSGKVTLSKFMKLLKGRFSRTVSMGRFWKPRFNFRIIEDEHQLENVVSYIQSNYRKHSLPEEYSKSPFLFIDFDELRNLFTPRT